LNSENKRLHAKVALITGGASGIGLCCARRFIAEGAKVIITDRDVDAGREASSEIGKNGLFLEHDVTDEQQWDETVRNTVDTFGALNILVNCAGVFRRGSIEDTSVSLWRDIMGVNLEGTFLGCRAALRAMKSTGGAIVNLSSTAAMMGDADYAAYDASKGGVRSLTKSIAVHCARQRYAIRCNSVHPGNIDTPMIQNIIAAQPDPEAEARIWQNGLRMGRYGRPEEVAALILFLSCDESSYVNGAEFVVDGGDMAGGALDLPS
jgi:3(or 17)beta-hydroxysteroid dehydrogenase